MRRGKKAASLSNGGGEGGQQGRVVARIKLKESGGTFVFEVEVDSGMSPGACLTGADGANSVRPMRVDASDVVMAVDQDDDEECGV